MNLPSTPLDPNIAKEQAAAQYANVQEQIEEIDAEVAQRAARIEQLDDAKRAERLTIRDLRHRQARLKKRRRIFARARFDLEQVDEE